MKITLRRVWSLLLMTCAVYAASEMMKYIMVIHVDTQTTTRGSREQRFFYNGRNQIYGCSSVFEATSSGHWIQNGGRLSWRPKACKLVIPSHGDLLELMKVPRKRRIVIIGDSQTDRLATALRDDLNCKGHPIGREMDRCSLNKYLGLNDSAEWHLPSKGQEGPTAFGSKNPRCMDCFGCRGALDVCWGTNWTFEYIPMDFARDVISQSTLYKTSQENIVHYIKEVGQPDVLIYNVGIHDVTLERAEVYERNLKWFTEMVEGAFPSTNFMFVNIAAVEANRVPSRFNLTRNSRIEEFNNIILNLFAKKTRISTINAWYMTANNFTRSNLYLPLQKNVEPDAVHFIKPYYNAVADIIRWQYFVWFQ